MTLAFFADGTRRDICTSQPVPQRWKVRERPRFNPSFALHVTDFAEVLACREIVLRRETLRLWGEFVGPMEIPGFEWVYGQAYARRECDYHDAFAAAWLLWPLDDDFLQWAILFGVVIRSTIDEIAFGPLCYREAVVLVEAGAPFYERWAS